MARYKNFLGSLKSITASTAQTLTWTGNDLPGSGLVALHCTLVGSSSTAQTIANVFTRLRVRADSETIFDVGPSAFRSHQQRFTQANYPLATTASAFSIWLNMPDIIDDDVADLCQFPKGAMCTVELTTNASVIAGSAYMGWSQSTIEPMYSPRMIGQQMNIPAGAINQAFPIQEPGKIRGYCLNTVGLDRAKLTLQGFVWEYLPGAVFLSSNVTTAPQGDMFRDSEQIEDGTTINDPIWHRVPEIRGSVGGSNIELTTTAATGSSWVGVTNELTYWAIREVPRAQAA